MSRHDEDEHPFADSGEGSPDEAQDGPVIRGPVREGYGEISDPEELTNEVFIEGDDDGPLIDSDE